MNRLPSEDSAKSGESPHAISPAFAATIREVHGAAGEEWIQRLPAILDAAARRWGLQLGPALEPLSYNYVLRATLRDGTAAVVKAGFPCRELEMELAALLLYAGEGMARLLAVDQTSGVFLLERLEPGLSLESVEDDVAATRIAAEVMRTIRLPAPTAGDFPTVAGWGRGFQRLRAAFDGGTGPFPSLLVHAAEELFMSLEATAAPAVLLHGNILAASGGTWRAIDPKGVVGEPAYEVGALLRNPSALYTSTSDPAAVTARRLNQLSEELGIDRQRLQGWGFAQAVLSAWWTHEDHGRVGDRALACAEWIQRA